MTILIPINEENAEHLKNELIKLGYKLVGAFEGRNFLCVHKEIKEFFALHNFLICDIHINYDVDLLFALLNMSEDPNGIPGEYWKFIRKNNSSDFTTNKLYKALHNLNERGALICNAGNPSGFNGSRNRNFEYFQKATVEEILEHFKSLIITPEVMAEKLKKIQELTRYETNRN